MATNKQKRERLARAEQTRREREQVAKRSRILRTGAIATAAVAVLAVAAFGYAKLTEDEPVVAPDGLTAQNGVRYPAANQPGGDAVEVIVYDDPMCPHCQDFEADHGDYLRTAADDGTITLEYRPVAILGDDSVEAVNAAACVLDSAGPEAFYEFHRLWFDDTDADPADVAAESGADGSGVADCIDSGTHDGWADKVTDDARADGLEGTPTVRINGKDVAFEDLDKVESLIEDAGR